MPRTECKCGRNIELTISGSPSPYLETPMMFFGFTIDAMIALQEEYQKRSSKPPTCENIRSCFGAEEAMIARQRARIRELEDVDRMGALDIRIVDLTRRLRALEDRFFEAGKK
jgi:hypothetical protein